MRQEVKKRILVSVKTNTLSDGVKEMTTSNDTLNKPSRLSGGITAGAILILIGILALAQNVIGFELGFMALLAAIFLGAALLTRNTGLLVPGCILAGISAGTVLMGGALPHATDIMRSSIFFFALAGGFGLISLLSIYTRGRAMLWPVFPAAGLAFFGATLLAGELGMRVLEVLGYAWPVILILLGAALILRRK